MGNSSYSIPANCRRIELHAPHDDVSQADLRVVEVPMPVPKSGEVLIKVVAAPVNPSDYGAWKPTNARDLSSSSTDGDNGFKPKAVGNEGSGIVVASGGGVYANSVVGKNVGFVTNVKGQGSYSEYCVVNALEGIFPLPDNVKCEAAASHFVNPYTACGFIDTVRARHASTGRGKGKPGFVHTAAASQLGQMLVKLCKQEDVTIINIVRKQEQEDILKALGAEHIIRSDQAGWEAKLAALMAEHNVRIAFDAIAGEMSGKLMDALPIDGSLYVYGVLSGEGCSGILPLDLIYRKKKMEGWYLGSWIKGETAGASAAVSMLLRLKAATTLVHGGLVDKDGWAVSQFVDCSLDDMTEKFRAMYKESGFTGQKLRIRFPQTEPAVTATTATTAAVDIHADKEEEKK